VYAKWEMLSLSPLKRDGLGRGQRIIVTGDEGSPALWPPVLQLDRRWERLLNVVIDEAEILIAYAERDFGSSGVRNRDVNLVA
jgi:hypothetical protein